MSDVRCPHRAVVVALWEQPHYTEHRPPPPPRGSIDKGEYSMFHHIAAACTLKYHSRKQALIINSRRSRSFVGSYVTPRI